MKRLITPFLFLLTLNVLSAQTQRTVLVEHFTQASCGPCAAVNPGFQALLEQNLNKVVSIRYQTSWPGYDPMHDHNPAQVNSRVSFYGVGAVPNSVLDGTGPESTNTLITQSSINARYAAQSNFEIAIRHELSPRLDEIFVTMEITALTDVNEELVAHAVVTEQVIAFASPPGSNGEREFHNVMKRMLPDVSGTPLPSAWTAGQKETLQLSWKMSNVYDLTQVGVVGFIQSRQGHAVHQAAYSEPHLTPAGPNDAILSKAAGTGDFAQDKVCGLNTSPVVEILNGGSSTLRSADIYYSINGGPEQHYEWTGFLTYLKKASVRLPDYTFDNRAVNTLSVRIENPNDASDDESLNNTITSEFYRAAQSTPVSKIEVKPATQPQKVTWEIVNAGGDVIVSGGPYTTPLVSVFTDITLNPDECYEMRVNNAASGFNGFVKMFDENGNEIYYISMINGGNFTAEFGTFEVTSIDNIVNESAVKIQPNPAMDFFDFQIPVIESSRGILSLFNALGKEVYSAGVQLQPGTFSERISVAGLPSGIYFVSLKAGDQVVSRRLIVQ